MADARARLVGLNHVALEVGDLEPRSSSTGASCASSCGAAAPGWRSSTRATSSSRSPRGAQGPRDEARHFGLVVDDREAVRAALAESGAEILPGRGLSFRDPWGNHVQVVEYADIQFRRRPR